MNLRTGLVFAVALGMTGCGQTAVEMATAPPAKDVAVPQAAQEPQNRATTPAGAAAPAAVAVEGGEAILSQENSKIEFVGVHLPPKQPDPRTGGFEKLSGKAKVNTAGKALESLNVEIDATSLWTEIGGRLTEHLKSPDFLEVREFPAIRFESTKIEPGQGQCQITGRLTMHGVTREISLPATVQIGAGSLTLRSEFSVDRLDYGIKYDPNAVGNKVSLTAVIGEKTQPRQGGGGFGGKGRGKGKRSGGGQKPGGEATP